MRKIGFALSAIAVLALLAGCGGEEHDGMDTPDAGSSAEANKADIAFATQMIPHHEQAIEMAKLAPSRADSAEVKALAERVEKAQDPEIATMTGWLTEWDAPVPTDGMDHGGHGDMADMADMPGMMNSLDMAKLEKAKGREFDRLWMTMMIEHHEGAIEMARTELADGSSADAKKLAQAIIDAQQAEIDEMNGLLEG